MGNRSDKRTTSPKNNDKSILIFTGVMWIITFIVLLSEFFKTPFTEWIFSFFFLVLVSLPFILYYRFNIKFPPILSLVLVGTLMIHTLGLAFEWYFIGYPYFDKLCHFGASLSLTLGLFFLFLLIDYRSDGRKNTNRWHMLILIIFLVVFSGILYEAGEEFCRQVGIGIGEERIAEMQELTGGEFNEMEDTLGDIIADTSGVAVAVVIIILGYAGYRKKMASNRKK